MVMTFYKSKITLEFKNPITENEYRNNLDKLILFYNKFLALLLVVFSIGDFLFQKMNLTNPLIFIKPWIVITYFCSICNSGLSILVLLLTLFIKNVRFNHFMCYLIFILFFFPFTHAMLIVTEMKNSQSLVYLINFFQFLIRGSMIFKMVIPYPLGLYVYLIQFIINCVYFSFIDNSVWIATTALIIIIQIVVSYYLTITSKEILYSKFLIEEQNRWYNNLLEHFNSGFISFNKIKINILNNYLQECIVNNTEYPNLIEDNGDKGRDRERENTQYVNNIYKETVLNFINDKNLFDSDTHNKSELYNMSLLKNNREKVLKVLLCDIHEDYNTVRIEKNANLKKIENENFHLDNYITQLKKQYFSKPMSEKFMFIGFKEFELENKYNIDSESQNGNEHEIGSGSKNKIKVDVNPMLNLNRKQIRRFLPMPRSRK